MPHMDPIMHKAISDDRGSEIERLKSNIRQLEKESYNSGLDTAISIVESGCFSEEKESIICGLESSKYVINNN